MVRPNASDAKGKKRRLYLVRFKRDKEKVCRCQSKSLLERIYL